MDTAIPSLLFERWATSRGPEWLAFVSQLKPLLVDEPAPPSDLKKAIAPLKWIMQQARHRRLPIDRNCVMERGFAIEANRRFGFDSPVTVNGEPTFLEVEMLLTIARNMGSTTPGEKSEVLTDCGRIIISKPELIWKEASTALGSCRPPGVVGELWEFALAWLLLPEAAPSALFPLLDEAADAAGKDVTDEGAYVELFQTGMHSLYTLARGLSMFLPEEPGQLKPLLSDMGRATAVRALRASVFYLRMAIDI